MKKNIIQILMLFIPNIVFASNTDGVIIAPGVTQWGQALFGVATSATFVGTKPACATAPNWTYWAIDLQTATGRAMWATVLMAHAQNKTLQVYGKNNCDAFVNRESVDWLFISN